MCLLRRHLASLQSKAAAISIEPSLKIVDFFSNFKLSFFSNLPLFPSSIPSCPIYILQVISKLAPKSHEQKENLRHLHSWSPRAKAASHNTQAKPNISPETERDSIRKLVSKSSREVQVTFHWSTSSSTMTRTSVYGGALLALTAGELPPY